MPHLRLEHSQNIPVEGLLHELDQILASQPSVQPEQIKSRAIPIQQAIVGGQPGRFFLHLQLSMKEGRSASEIEVMLDQLHARLRQFSVDQAAPVAVSTHVVELKASHYRTQNITA